MTDRPITEFNGLPEAEARAVLGSCLDVPRWIDIVVAARPYAGLAALVELASATAATVTEPELAQALAKHPRIGERADAEQHDAEFSAREQSSVDRSDAELVARLRELNRAYEQRFDRIFLIRAAGRTSAEILEELSRRLGNDDDTEHRETVDQLRQIALLRLEQVV